MKLQDFIITTTFSILLASYNIKANAWDLGLSHESIPESGIEIACSLKELAKASISGSLDYSVVSGSIHGQACGLIMDTLKRFLNQPKNEYNFEADFAVVEENSSSFGEALSLNATAAVKDNRADRSYISFDNGQTWENGNPQAFMSFYLAPLRDGVDAVEFLLFNTSAESADIDKEIAVYSYNGGAWERLNPAASSPGSVGLKPGETLLIGASKNSPQMQAGFYKAVAIARLGDEGQVIELETRFRISREAVIGVKEDYFASLDARLGNNSGTGNGDGNDFASSDNSMDNVYSPSENSSSIAQARAIEGRSGTEFLSINNGIDWQGKKIPSIYISALKDDFDLSNGEVSFIATNSTSEEATLFGACRLFINEGSAWRYLNWDQGDSPEIKVKGGSTEVITLNLKKYITAPGRYRIQRGAKFDSDRGQWTLSCDFIVAGDGKSN